MKFSIKTLLLFLCINMSNLTSSIADEIPISQDALKHEILEKDYIKIEISEDHTGGLEVTILKPLSSLLKILKVKYYSLLNWTQHSRQSDLQIESYDRTLKFGRWINDPNDEACFNTRALVLIRDSVRQVEFKDSNHCSVASGKWNDPYTGQAFKSSEDIQIDHFIPLKNAYMSGAYKWSFRARCLYANFLGSDYHLLSVNGSQNMSKGDRAPDRYIPPNSEYTCTYIKNWLSIKFLWGLKMTAPEAEAIAASIKNNHCNARNLYISQREILRQSQFFKENIDLCEKLDAARKITIANQ